MGKGCTCRVLMFFCDEQFFVVGLLYGDSLGCGVVVLIELCD